MNRFIDASTAVVPFSAAVDVFGDQTRGIRMNRRLCCALTLTLLVVGVAPYSRAQELGKFKDNDEWLQFVHNLVNKYYPDVPHEPNLPDGYTLAFVLRDRDTVLEHTALALHEPEDTRLTETMFRIFPDAGIDPKGQMEQGSLCVKAEPGKHGRYCVYYVVPPKESSRN